MELAGRSGSWRVDEGCSRALLLALFVRDASGLEVPMDRAVPKLDPAAELHAQLTPLAHPRAAADWPAWWAHEIDSVLAPTPQDADLWFGRPLIGRELRALLVRAAPLAYAWTLDRDREHRDLFTRQLRERGPLTVDVVREVEREIGRTARPFSLRIDVLPVHGLWGVRVGAGHVLVSRSLRSDPVAFPTFLEPVIQRLA